LNCTQATGSSSLPSRRVDGAFLPSRLPLDSKLWVVSVDRPLIIEEEKPDWRLVRRPLLTRSPPPPPVIVARSRCFARVCDLRQLTDVPWLVVLAMPMLSQLWRRNARLRAPPDAGLTRPLVSLPWLPLEPVLLRLVTTGGGPSGSGSPVAARKTRQSPKEPMSTLYDTQIRTGNIASVTAASQMSTTSGELTRRMNTSHT